MTKQSPHDPLAEDNSGPGTFATFRQVVGFLPRHERRKLLLFAFSAILVAALETLSVASIALFATTVADPEMILRSKSLHLAFSLFPDLMPQNQLALVLLVSGLMVLLLLVKNGFRVLQAYYFSKYTGQLEYYFGALTISGFLTMPYEWHLSKNSADLQYLMYARTNIGRSFTEAWLQLGTEVVMVGMLLAALLLDKPLISLGVLSFCGLAGVVILRMNKPVLNRIAQNTLQDKIAINSHCTKAIHGIKDIRLLQKERQILLDYGRLSEPLARHVALQKVLSLIPGSLLETFGFLAMSVFVWILLATSDASTGSVLASVTLLAVTAWRILPAMSRILNSATMIRNALPDVHLVLDFLHTATRLAAPLPRARKDAPATAASGTQIRFENVSFHYEGAAAPALHDVSFVVESGQTIGIIGRSGAGKSTLVDVLVGFFFPSKGRILINGEILSRETLPDWLDRIGYVPQFPYIGHGTLAENVAFGVPSGDIDLDRVRRCCAMARVDFLDDLPDDIQTFIGERGVKLSGGQLQRVSIARALYPAPEVIIFDEATSALDAHAEEAILQTIFSLSRDHTVLIIAHNMETVERCDRIIWLEGGRVRTQGEPSVVIPQYAPPENNARPHSREPQE